MWAYFFSFKNTAEADLGSLLCDQSFWFAYSFGLRMVDRWFCGWIWLLAWSSCMRDTWGYLQRKPSRKNHKSVHNMETSIRISIFLNLKVLQFPDIFSEKLGWQVGTHYYFTIQLFVVLPYLLNAAGPCALQCISLRKGRKLNSYSARSTFTSLNWKK